MSLWCLNSPIVQWFFKSDKVNFEAAAILHPDHKNNKVTFLYFFHPQSIRLGVCYVPTSILYVSFSFTKLFRTK